MNWYNNSAKAYTSTVETKLFKLMNDCRKHQEENQKKKKGKSKKPKIKFMNSVSSVYYASIETSDQYETTREENKPRLKFNHLSEIDQEESSKNANKKQLKRTKKP